MCIRRNTISDGVESTNFILAVTNNLGSKPTSIRYLLTRMGDPGRGYCGTPYDRENRTTPVLLGHLFSPGTADLTGPLHNTPHKLGPCLTECDVLGPPTPYLTGAVGGTDRLRLIIHITRPCFSGRPPSLRLPISIHQRAKYRSTSRQSNPPNSSLSVSVYSPQTHGRIKKKKCYDYCTSSAPYKNPFLCFFSSNGPELIVEQMIAFHSTNNRTLC